MAKYQIILLLLILTIPKRMNGQTANPDTIRNIKVYEKIIPKMEFDSARISPNGKYALVLKDNYLNGCYINYWNLYESGVNKPIVERIVLLKGYAYFISFEKTGITGKLNYTQNDEKFDWDITKKCHISELVQQYGLTVHPKNNARNLEITFSILPDIKIKIPQKVSSWTVGDSLERPAQRIVVKFAYHDHEFYTTQITFLSNPEGFSETEKDFSSYYNAIQKEVFQSPFGNDYGMLFLTAGDFGFLRFEVESNIYNGYHYVKVDNIEYVETGSAASPGAKFEFLGEIGQ